MHAAFEWSAAGGAVVMWLGQVFDVHGTASTGFSCDPHPVTDAASPASIVPGIPSDRLAQEVHLAHEPPATLADREVQPHCRALDDPGPAIHRFRNQPVNLLARSDENHSVRLFLRCGRDP
jgi:hypothetical protein